MAWTESIVFRQTLIDALDGTMSLDFDSATANYYRVALMNNSVTPDMDATAANIALGAGTWTGNEVTGANWAAGGIALTTVDLKPKTSGIYWDADDVSVATVTVTGAYGCLVYADGIATPVANQGVCANYFGGTAYSSVAGTFAITWHATNGLWHATKA